MAASSDLQQATHKVGLPLARTIASYLQYWALLMALCGIMGLTAGCSSPIPGGDTNIPTFESGGLGLTKADWEQNHIDPSLLGTPANPCSSPYSRTALYGAGTGPYCDEHKYAVTFWYEGPQSQELNDTLITGIGFRSQSTDPDVKLAEARALMPVDAQLKEKGTTKGAHHDWFAIYHSKSLETRYPPLPSVPDPWKDNTPGDIYVIYNTGDVHSASVEARLTELPPLEPPTEVPPTITPFILLPTQVPTEPLPIVPTPVPTGGGVLPPLPEATGDIP